MTVAELMARLEALAPNLRVVMPSEDGDFCEVAAAFVDTVFFDGSTAQLTDERDPEGLVHVVRLFEPDEA
ncbi:MULTISPECIES: hypothetical protein [unclassified Phenylobacterium]|uniref:hypothetical protein n=1 Tax=unclassified Phenylobacterium TaxID=2640670 RepID=UPI00083B8823|nr:MULTISPECIES: hypothetical protein [unclassified Phenylobacterium]